MKSKTNKIKIVIILFLLLITTGCTKVLTDNNKKAVKNEKTGQTLTENILCQPTSKKTADIYKKYKVKIEKLPECKNFKINSGKYEGLWTTVFVKPLAYILLVIGRAVKNYGLSVIIVSLAIRLIAYPITKKTAMQSEIMKKAQPELNRLKKKYEGKQDQESLMKQNQEMMAIYKKYKINPMAGCLFAMLQLPIFIAFFEAVQRTPVIFEDKFLGLQLGTTTFFSFKMNSAGNMEEPSMKMMPTMMSIMIVVTGVFMPTGLGIYWVTSNLFTVVQNILVKRSKEVNGKA